MPTITEEEFELFKKLLEKENKRKEIQRKSYKKFYLLNKDNSKLTEEELKIKKEKIEIRKKKQLERYYNVYKPKRQAEKEKEEATYEKQILSKL